MSRMSKWTLEKAKVKVVFRLQFHATHVPQAGWDKLFISFIPSDSGKATAKTTKAIVRNGTCKWGDPIYETTRLLHDSRSKLYDQKLYKFVVAMGSSRSSILGEACINLADYADALKPSIISLPLEGCSSGTILHVTVQLLTSKTGFREFEQQRELRERGLQTGADINSRDGGERVSSSEDMSNDQTVKVNARVKLRPEPKELPSLEEESGLNEEYANSLMGFDGSSNTSGSLYTEKHDNSSVQEIDSLNYSVDNDLAISNEENSRLRGSLELAESTILELKLEVVSLRSHADEIGRETRKFTQQITAEISSSEELAEEISIMKLECSKLKGDLQQLISLKSSPPFDNLYQDIQLRWRKGLSVVEDKIKDIQRKVYLSLDDREARVIHMDFEALLTVLLKLKQENLPSETANCTHKSEQYLSSNNLDMDLFHPPDMLHCLSIPQGHDSLIATKAMEDKIFELLRELDGSKVEREDMIRKMNEMECYYEALIVELEENQKQMLVELHNLRSENSTCLYTVATTNAEIESIRQDTNEQILRFSQERHESDLICKELERRAITSEAALKRARLNYSIAVDQLQKDLDLLSSQVLSMFETNENLIRKTCSEGFQFHSQNMGTTTQITGGDVLIEDMKKSLLFQEELYHKVEEELSEMHLANVYLDIFVKILRESLLQASSDIILMERKIEVLVQQLDLSTESKRLLSSQLQSAMRDMAHENQILGLKSEGLSNENFLLAEKIAQLEALLRECSSYKTEFEVCSAEKAELANLLTQETVSKVNLQKETSFLFEKLELVESEKSDLAHYNENLQKLVDSLEKKLRNLLESYSEKFNGTFSSANVVSRDIKSVDLISVVSQIEEIQLNASEKTRQLLEEKKVLEDERDRAQISSSTAKSEIIAARQDLEIELLNVGAKLEASNVLVEKLQLELEALANKLHTSSEAEEKYAKQNRELVDRLADLEGELQNLISRNMDLDKEILGMKNVADELERSKSTVDDLTLKMQELSMSLENKDGDNAKLASELDSIKENFRFLHDELVLERSSKDNLEGAVGRLTSQVIEGNEQLLRFAEKEAELLHTKKRAADLELQKKNLEDDRDQAYMVSSSASSEVLAANTKFKHDMGNMATNLEASNALMEKFQAELENLVIKLHSSLETEEKYENQHQGLLDNFTVLEAGLQDLIFKNMELAKEISGLNIVSEDLGACKLTIAELTQERKTLMLSCQDKASENFKLESELDRLKQNMESLHDELDRERSSKDKLQRTIDHLMVQLEKKKGELLHFSQQEAELVHFGQMVSDLQKEKKNLEDERDQAQAVSFSTSSEILVTKQKFKQDIQNMSAKLEATDALVVKLESELESLSNKLQTSSEAEELYAKENKDLLVNLSNLEGNLQDLTSENTELANNISCLNTVTEELESCKLTLLEVTQEKQELMILLQDKAAEIVKLESELDNLKESLRSLHDELHRERSSMDNLHGTIEHVTFQLNEKNEQLFRFSQQEAELAHFQQLASHLECEISKLHEYIISSDIKLVCVRSQYEMGIEELVLNFDSSGKQVKEIEVEISEKLPVLSEQEIDCLMSSQRETDILVIFFKAKFNELKDQFACLGENNDELAKLQRMYDELNNRLSEQVLKTKEFENLSAHLKELKDKAEAGPSSAERESLRIAFIKEQYESMVQELRNQVSVSKRNAEDMLLKFQDSVDELENAKRSEAAHLKRNEELSLKVSELEGELKSVVSEKREKVKAYELLKGELECALLSLECCKEEKEKHEASLQEYDHSNGRKDRGVICETTYTATSPKFTDEHSIANGERIKEEEKHSTVPANLQSSRSALVPENGHGISKHEHASLEQGMDDGPDNFAVINHRTKIQSLRSSMDHLQQELERMKNENSLLPHERQHTDASVLHLQTELLQLNEANEQLRTRFPLFDELPDNGSALERVFALEVELAEALQAKNKSNILLQSSFLKQHGDERAIFQSFRDINELIKEMLELKGKHTSMEKELQDMHDRYSQLSLQLAEVEGERQKLIMTLKNTRSPKKFMIFNRSTSATLE